MDLYGKGLACAADLQQQAVKAATAKARQTAVIELTEWLHTTGIRTMQSATPEDMLVYLIQHWLPNHAGSITSGGELIAAPSSLSGTKSHLAKEFELLGRSGDWNSATQTGNPMHSIQIKTMVTGYANHAAEQGYQKKGAVPLSAAEMEMLLGSLHDKQHSMTSSTESLLLIRDGLLLSLLCQTCFRGFNAGGLRLDNILLPTGGSALPYLALVRQLGRGAKLHLLPDSTKNKKGGHCSISLTCDVLCFTTWLQLALHQYAVAGQPITDYLTRPLQVGTKVFSEKLMTSSNVWARLTKHLKESGMYTGQSVHNTRRGNMMHQQMELHKSNQEIAEAAMCNEQSVKYYTEPHTPTRFRGTRDQS